MDQARLRHPHAICEAPHHQPPYQTLAWPHRYTKNDVPSSMAISITSQTALKGSKLCSNHLETHPGSVDFRSSLLFFFKGAPRPPEQLPNSTNHDHFCCAACLHSDLQGVLFFRAAPPARPISPSAMVMWNMPRTSFSLAWRTVEIVELSKPQSGPFLGEVVG